MSQLLTDIHELVTNATAWVVAVGAGTVLGYHKIKRMISTDNRATEDNNAYSAVITMLRAEVTDMSAQNIRFAQLINSLQLQVIALRDENAELRAAFLTNKRDHADG